MTFRQFRKYVKEHIMIHCETHCMEEWTSKINDKGLVDIDSCVDTLNRTTGNAFVVKCDLCDDDIDGISRGWIDSEKILMHWASKHDQGYETHNTTKNTRKKKNQND